MITIIYGCGNFWHKHKEFIQTKFDVNFICDQKLDLCEEDIYEEIPIIKTADVFDMRNICVIICAYEANMIRQIQEQFKYPSTIRFEYYRAQLSGSELLNGFPNGKYEDLCQNIIYFDDTIPNSIKIYMIGNNNCLKLGRNLSVTDELKIYMGCEADVIIGNDTTFISCEIDASWGSIHIGNDCMFSWNTFVRNDDGHHIFDMEKGERLNLCGIITIEDHCWIGQDALILKNVHIGNGSIVGARAVVTRNIGNHSIAVGNPATVVKDGILWKRNWTKLENIKNIDMLK